MPRPDPALVTATAASLALVATLLLLPEAPWRAPLALLAGVWAPGYALLANLYPSGRLSALERHALAAAAGLLMLPLVALAVSESLGFRPLALGGAQLALVALLAGLAHARGGAPEPALRSPLPSWRFVAAVGAGALVAAGATFAPALVAREAAPLALAFEPFDATPERSGEVRVVVVAFAGDAHVEATLRITWGNDTLDVREVALAPGDTERVEVSVPVARESQRLAASWAGREVHATLRAEGR